MVVKVSGGNFLSPLGGGIASEIAVIIGAQVAREVGKAVAANLWRTVSQPRVEQRVERVDQIQNVFIDQSHGVQLSEANSQPKGLAEKRQDFHIDFLNHTLKQSEWTFRLSVRFMTGGALIILTGAALALVHAGKPDRSYLPLVTSLTGALMTGGGGTLALHSKRTMANLAKAAESNENKIDVDRKLEAAMTFIDRVEDPQMKDRLNSAAALKALGMEAQPETMVNRLLPDQQPKQIELGDPTG
ncbi:TRADD-N-associated membrane domain-containing protein [Streptomyces caelestis]|uniref:TRADD-N-associated membrane domain-containing protein n=1 Tax=Streptomyces caelestis TaxID=36816 RepID=UPI0036FE0C78